MGSLIFSDLARTVRSRPRRAHLLEHYVAGDARCLVGRAMGGEEAKKYFENVVSKRKGP